MKKKKKVEQSPAGFDPEVLRMYMMGATNPGFSNKLENASDIIDLHLEQHQTGRTAIPAHDALFYQLDIFEKALDRAVASGKLEFRVVHGLGKGKLKQEIYKLLEKHPQVKSFENTYHSKFGYGSTIIYLK